MTARLERHTEETLRHTDTQTHRLTRHTARAELPHIPSERTALHHRRFAPRTAQRHATGNATSTVTQTSGKTLATPTSTPRRPTSGGKGRLRGAIARAPEAPAHPCLSIAPRRVGQPTGQAFCTSCSVEAGGPSTNLLGAFPCIGLLRTFFYGWCGDGWTGFDSQLARLSHLRHHCGTQVRGRVVVGV